MKRLIITASLLGGMLYQAGAQEFTIGINGAQAGTRYKLPDGRLQMKPSLGAELGLQVRLNNHLKILTGVEAFRYQTKATLADNKVYSHHTVDDMGSSFEYRVVTSNYAETQTFTSLRVPLVLQYVAGNLQKTQWYFNLGGKFVLPATIAVKASVAKLTTTGYYPDVHAEVHDLPQHGFGTLNNWQGNGNYSTKQGWILTAGTGFSFKLTPSGATRLYAGVYADYGLGNLQSNTTPLPLVTYNAQNLANVQPNGTMGMAGVQQLQLMNFGIQLKLGFGHRQKTKKVMPMPTAPPAAKALQMQEARKLPAADTAQPAITAAELNWIQQPVFFSKKNNTQLSTAAKQQLAVVASMLSKHPGTHLLIKGHTCNIGTPVVNQRRSLERATVLADYLASQGVSKERMEVIAMGAAEPLVPNDAELNREKNRRAAIVVIEAPKK